MALLQLNQQLYVFFHLHIMYRRHNFRNLREKMRIKELG